MMKSFCLTHYITCIVPLGHSERAMLYHELEDGLYSVTSYFFAKVRRHLVINHQLVVKQHHLVVRHHHLVVRHRQLVAKP